MRVLIIFYDNERRDNILPLGMVYIAGYLKPRVPDAEIVYYCQDVYHYPDEHLTEYLNHNHFDFAAIGFAAGYYQHDKVISLCNAIHRSDDPPKIVLGGHGASGAPQYFLNVTGADYVVVGEGEDAFHQICTGEVSSGIVTGNIVEDLDSIPFPYLDGIPIEHYVKSGYLTQTQDRGMSMISSRGCPYHCNFCYRLMPGHRFRSPQNVAEEIKKYKMDYGINFIWFWDELWMASQERVREMCEAIKPLGIRFFCTGRLNIANDRILQTMKDAGCVAIDYGIEQFDNDALTAMNKRQTEAQIEKVISMTLGYGMQPLFNIIWGNVGDTIGSLEKSLDFLHRYNDHKQLRAIRPVTPYPGSPLYQIAVDRGLITDHADFYRKHKNLEIPTCNFMEGVTETDIVNHLWKANKEIIDRYYEYHAQQAKSGFYDVYFNHNYAFRGVRH